MPHEQRVSNAACWWLIIITSIVCLWPKHVQLKIFFLRLPPQFQNFYYENAFNKLPSTEILPQRKMILMRNVQMSWSKCRLVYFVLSINVWLTGYIAVIYASRKCYYLVCSSQTSFFALYEKWLEQDLKKIVGLCICYRSAWIPGRHSFWTKKITHQKCKIKIRNR